VEGQIAQLLKDFEDGKMTRRQLIQSLAMVAMTAGVATRASAQTAAKAPWKTVYLDHISYAVADYKKSVEFYTSLMGWEVEKDSDNGRQATLKIGNIGGIIIRNSRQPDTAAGAPAAAPAAAQGAGPAGRPRPPLTGVINHVSWGISPWDTEGVKAELERRGLNPRPDMVGADFKSYHVTDPDGWDLQISNQTGPAKK
jgi:catechol 2,3-dioxygenase-like lactoylglutathione lyase family enzyme